MCFKRIASLGNYNASKDEWYYAYSNARTCLRHGLEISCNLEGIWWKAILIAEFDKDRIDNLTIPIENRLYVHKLLSSED